MVSAAKQNATTVIQPEFAVSTSQRSLPPLLYRAADAAAVCNTSVRTWRTWDATGRIPQAIRIGRKVFWRPEDLRAWVAAGCPDRLTWEVMREL